jgi:hypothetical protein
VFQPTTTFTLPEGWLLAADSADYLQLRPAGQDLLGIHLFRGVTAASQADTCPTEPEPGVGTTASELVAWIRGLDGLLVSSPALVTVGGLRGASIDVGIADGWTESCPFANGAGGAAARRRGTDLRWSCPAASAWLYLLDLPDGSTLIVDIDDSRAARSSRSWAPRHRSSRASFASE